MNSAVIQGFHRVKPPLGIIFALSLTAQRLIRDPQDNKHVTNRRHQTTS